MSTPLLRTKLYIPTPRLNLVPRPRLIERLNAGMHRKLAPMRSISFIIRPGWVWQDDAAERVGRWLQAACRLALAGRRG